MLVLNKNKLRLIRLSTFALLLLRPGFSHGYIKSNNIITTRFLTVEDGLASNIVYCGLQDNDGFIWLGTNNGLNRYDGNKFILFSKKTGLRSNCIVEIVESTQNDLWILYGLSGYSKIGGNGLDILRPKTNQLISFDKIFPYAPFKDKDILGIKSNGDGKIIILTFKGYYQLDQTNNFKKLFNESVLKDAYVFNNNIFYHDNAWLNSWNYGLTYFRDGKQIASFENDTKQKAVLGIQDNGNAIAVTSNQGKNHFMEFNFLNEKKEANYIDNKCNTTINFTNDFPSLRYNANYNSSVLHSNILCCYEENNFFELLDAENLKNFPAFNLEDYFVDKQKRKWVCTTNGVFVFDKKQNYFQTYFNDSNSVSNRENFNQARSIYADSAGDLYAAIGAGLFRSDVNGTTKDQFLSDRYFLKKGIKRDGIIYGLLKNKNIYVALTDKLLILDSSFAVVDDVPISIFAEIWNLFRLDSNRIIGGCRGGLFVYNEKDKRIENKVIIDNSFLYKILKSKDGVLWAAGASGLYILYENGKIKNHLSAESKDIKFKIPYSDLLDVYEDNVGYFWLATNGDGLYRWDRNKNEFKNISRDDGLSSNTLYGILEDDYDNLWISSDYGLNRFNKTTFQNTIYTEEDGLNNNEFNRTSFYKSKDGRMYFGGVNGVNGFNPMDFISDSLVFNAPFKIISFNQFDGKNNKLIDKTVDLINSQKITLQPGDAFFTMQFQLLDFETGKHNYAYRIDGIDKDWNFINENSIRFSGLPVGKFILHVKAQNPLGVWSTDEIIIPITVFEPLLHQTWFRLLLILSVIALLIVVIRYREYRLSRDRDALERTVELRTGQMRELLKDKDILMKEIHHRVKNNLQVIGNLLEIQGENQPDEKSIQAFNEAHARVRSVALIHQNLYRQDDLTSIEYKGFVDELAKSVSTIFKPDGKIIEIDNYIPEIFFDIDTAIPLGLILNELLTNSYKYAFNDSEYGNIKIKLQTISDGTFHLIYSDSGSGLKKDFNIETTTSIGLRLIHRLATQLMGEVTYINESESVFIIQFKNSYARKMEE